MVTLDFSDLLPHSLIVPDLDNSPNHKLISLHPEDCKNILATRNPRNRSVRRNTVVRYAEDLKNGRFPQTHEPICFDEDGNLLDGQHRLHSVVLVNRPYNFRVWINRPSSHFTVIDSGVARLASDNLQHLGVPRPKIVAPGIKHLLLYKKYPNRTWSNLEMPSSAAIQDFYSNNQDAVDKTSALVQQACKRFNSLNRTGVFVTCFLALEAGYGEMDIAAFCANLSVGAGLAEDSPILAYRNYLHAPSVKNIKDRNLQQFSVACLIKAWNYAHQKESLRQFKPPQYPPMPTIALASIPNTSTVSKALRYSILNRDDFTCQACGAKAVDGAVLEVDHIIPRSKGGSNEASNLTTLCSNCNGGKSNKTEADLFF